MVTNDNCLFCKINAKQIPAAVIFEDDHALAFLDIQPRAYGHALVIPKYHAENILTLPAEEVGPVFSVVKNVADMLTKKLSADGLTIGMNQGAASGQEVGHLHIHLIPRFHNDGGGAIQSVVRKPSDEPIDAVQKRILG